MNISRRRLVRLSAATLAGAAVVTGRAQAAVDSGGRDGPLAATQPPLFPSAGPPYRPVVTLNGWTLPFRMNGDWKEFHLVAEPVGREIAPGMVAHLWGYNGQSPGPTIECVEGDKVRIFVTNRLPEHTRCTGMACCLPNGMDGVGGLTQPAHRSRQDLRLRVRAAPERDVHVPPACRRDGADGDGHDGELHRPSPRSRTAPRRSRLRFPPQQLRRRSRQLHAAGHHHDRVQFVDLEHDGCSPASIPWRCAGATACGYASAISP